LLSALRIDRLGRDETKSEQGRGGCKDGKQHRVCAIRVHSRSPWSRVYHSQPSQSSRRHAGIPAELLRFATTLRETPASFGSHYFSATTAMCTGSSLLSSTILSFSRL
jgi:hypothetical protein